MVVEDNHAVRAFVVEALRDFGYEVLEAASGSEAIAVSQRHDGPIDLLLSDMIMPVMPGAEVARALTRERAELQVMFMSGYMGDSVNPDEIVVSGERYSLLPKPFTATELCDRVESALNGRKVGLRARSAS